MSDLWANDSTQYDDDDVYEDYCPKMDTFPASIPMINLDLYVNQNVPAIQAQGGTKSHFTPVQGGTVLLDDSNKSDYRFSVERLAWVDGWQESTTVEGKLVQKQPMTLAILRFNLQTFDQDLRVQSVRATLQLKDVDKHRGDDPEIQAWAPFHDLESWNPTKAEHKDTTNTNATASGGYGGSSLSLGWDNGNEISWNRTYFDEGRSILETSKRKQRPNGVTWFLKQNKLENLGVTPTIWAAVLFKRTTPDLPYLVKFRLVVQTGTLHDLKGKVRKYLGMKQRDTSSFTATPRPGVWDKSNCFGEGEVIGDNMNIDLNNLGTLLDKNQTTLRGVWGPQYQHSAPRVKEVVEQERAATSESVHNTSRIIIAHEAAPICVVEPPLSKTAGIVVPVVTKADVRPGLPLADPELPSMVPSATSNPEQGRPMFESFVDPAIEKQSPAPSQPSYHRPNGAMGSSGIEIDTSSGRLADVEARIASVEGRLVTQEFRILQLQRAVDSRDTRLARMEQAMRVAAATLSQL